MGWDQDQRSKIDVLYYSLYSTSLLYNNCTTSQEPGNTESTDERIQLFQQRYSNKIEVIDNF